MPVLDVPCARGVRDPVEAAARRGVDVTLVLPGISDFWAVHAAGRSNYGRLLAATWRRRGIAQRAREAAARMLEYWL